jgi:hypothetical protein
MRQALATVLGGAAVFAAFIAQAQEAPCRTPCLALPRAKAEAPAKAPAPAPVAQARQARPQQRSAPPPSPVVGALQQPMSRRCTDITMRAQVGEPVSDRDMAYLRSDC